MFIKAFEKRQIKLYQLGWGVESAGRIILDENTT
jgi:hypothetical protein